MLTVLAPAKLNLTLEVLAERQDGFHEIRSVVQTINLCDTLYFQPSHSINFSCADPDWIPERSLVSKAAALLQKTTGCSKGATVEVDKHIPLVSGLSGDSSDAAATLWGLNQLWELGLPPKELLRLASKLGSDVSFFLYGGTALLEGRGEIVTPLLPLPHMWVVLMMPPVPRLPGKTARLYATLKTSHYTQGKATDRLLKALAGRSFKGLRTLKANTPPPLKNKGIDGERLASNVFNVFDAVACDSFTGLSQYREQFLEAGAEEVHLAGSGPALFTLVKDKLRAEEIYLHLWQQGLESYLTDTLANIERVK